MEDTNYRMTMTELEDKLLVDVYSREDDCQNLVMTLDIGGHDYFALAEDMRAIANVLDLDYVEKQNAKIDSIKDKSWELEIELAQVQHERDALRTVVRELAQQYLAEPRWVTKDNDELLTMQHLVITLVHQYIGGDDE